MRFKMTIACCVGLFLLLTVVPVSSLAEVPASDQLSGVSHRLGWDSG